MSSVSPLINFGKADALEAKRHCAVACGVAVQSFSKINDLKMHARANKYPYASFEPDIWLLDGSFRIKPASDTNVHVGLMTAELSDSAGNIVTPYLATFTLDRVYNTDGFILHFDDNSDDFCTSVIVSFYNASNALIQSDHYYPTSSVFSTYGIYTLNITAFKKITVAFYTTNKPYRFSRLLDIDFFPATYFGRDEIKTCNLTEQIDPSALTLPFNTLDFRLFTDNPEFSIIEPAGGYTLLQDNQPLYCYEDFGGSVTFMGKFYLDTWKNISEKEIEMHAIDLIGVLDKMTWGGDLVGETADQFLTNKLLTPAGIDYFINASLSGVNVTGWMPICSYRVALQHMLLAIGGYATCARDSVINIYPIQLASDIVYPYFTADETNKGANNSVELKSLVTGVELASHNYNFGGVSSVVFSATLPVGQHTILFDEPKYDSNMTVTGATVVSSNVNRVVVDVTSPGTVEVTIERLQDSSRFAGVYNPALPTGTVENVLTLSDTTLVNTLVLEDTAQRVYDYLQQRYLSKMTIFLSNAFTYRVGNSVYIDTYNSRQLAGIIEKIEGDLTNISRAKYEIVGIVKAL
jgi:hypothetical protein